MQMKTKVHVKRGCLFPPTGMFWPGSELASLVVPGSRRELTYTFKWEKISAKHQNALAAFTPRIDMQSPCLNMLPL